MATSEKNTTAKITQSESQPASTTARNIIILILGDALAFLVFAAIGRSSHGESSGLTALPQVAWTALPFALGWFLVAPLVGAFKRDLVADPRKMATRTLLSWLLAWPVGLFFRWLFTGRTHLPEVSFALITLLSNTIFLTIWRLPFAFTNSMRKKSRKTA